MWKTENIAEFVLHAPGNHVPPDKALTPETVGMRLFDAPIFAVGDPADPLFAALRQPQAVGPHLLLPEQWLPGCRSVVSFFLPFSDAVKKTSAPREAEPTPSWLHGRVEGQAFVLEVCREIRRQLEAEGEQAVIPAEDPRFWSVDKPGTSPTAPDPSFGYTSCWSERHVAYVCGLGTFGLSKGLITEKGICGRFGSLVTTALLPRTVRAYQRLYDYCIRCGACARNCPAGAISLETGKAHLPCREYQAGVLERHAPYFGCGKCQVGVPCMSGIPGGKRGKI